MPPKPQISTIQVSRPVIIFSLLAGLVYLYALIFLFEVGTVWLWALLVAGEVFHLWQAGTYAFTIWNLKTPEEPDPTFSEPVDVYITVVSEPIEIVEQTVRAALEMDYPNHTVWICSDAKNANNPDWEDYERLAKRLGARCITHTVKGGAKAGNINKAMKITTAPYIVIFDADHIPHRDFLRKTMGHFKDPKMGFVQTPQYYKNHAQNAVTQASWEQQEIFFGPILKGKERNGTAFMCGTNMVLRRQAIIEAGGMCETSIAEDFLTSMYVHAAGYKSVYVPEILAEGLAPEDFLSYYKQQFRWARGSLEVIFRNNVLLKRGLTWPQKLQYLSSASYWLNGIIVLIDALLPLVFFYTGAVVFEISTMTLAAVFLPYIFLSLYLLQVSSNFSYTYRALSFSLSSFWLQIVAAWSAILGKKVSFAVTSKTALTGNFVRLVIPHIIYIVAALVGFGYAVSRDGLTASVLSNAAWAVFNIAIFLPFIIAALPSRATAPAKIKEAA